MAELLVDTDVCTAHLAGVRRLPRGAGRLGYSVLTRAELLAGAEGDEEPDVRRLLASMEEIPVDRRIADRVGHLRHEVPTPMHARHAHPGHRGGALAVAPQQERPALPEGPQD